LVYHKTIQTTDGVPLRKVIFYPPHTEWQQNLPADGIDLKEHSNQRVKKSPG